jgi:hypothetical protein
MQRHDLKVTCRTHEHHDIAIVHTSRFGITVMAYFRAIVMHYGNRTASGDTITIFINCDSFLLKRVTFIVYTAV